MKIRLFLLVFCFSQSLFAQNPLTKDQFANAEKIIDLELTDAERDSLLSQAQNYLLTYKAMHKQKIENSLAPALFFDPSVEKRDRSEERRVGKEC